MTPKGKRNFRINNQLRLDADQVAKWSFTNDTIFELQNRFIKGKGYNYWDQYLQLQPDLMVAAECALKDVNDPFTGRQKKKYECPTGKNCLEICADG